MRRLNLRKFIFFPLSILLFTAACAPRPDWAVRMLDKPVCLAPCWDGITPGKTTQDELSQLLKQDPGTFDVTAGVGDPWGRTLSWCVGGSPCGPGKLSVLSAFDDRGIVQEVYLRPGIPLYIKDFVPLYGPPEKVAFSDTLSAPGNILVGLLYPNSGLVLEFLVENLGTFESPAVDFREDLEAVNIIYTLPVLDYYFSINVVAKKVEQFEWKGFVNYP
jgi:hypothetical protein